MVMKIAIQGIEGSFHDEAAHKLASQPTLVPCRSFQDVFAAVMNGQADAGVVAIENSIHGSINAVYRLLDRHNLWVAGETSLHIDQHLIGTQQLPLDKLNISDTRILSQAPALAQVELWLDKHLPHATREETGDTAESVRTVMGQDSPYLLAVAGKHAAQLYGGTIIAGPINDDPHNYTRFVLLQTKAAVPPNANRTSIILTTDNAPGALYNALGIFARLDINLSKLDSHPIPGDTRHYAFYIDLETGADAPAARNAFKQLQDAGYTAKVLGSYRVV